MVIKYFVQSLKETINLSYSFQSNKKELVNCLEKKGDKKINFERKGTHIHFIQTKRKRSIFRKKNLIQTRKKW